MSTQSDKTQTEKKPERVIVTHKGSRYDVTDFLSLHPGGGAILQENNGKDVENLMAEIGHSDYAFEVLQSYKIDD